MSIRQNLLPRSEDFANAAWFKLNATVTANLVEAPDGTLTGDGLFADGLTSVGHFAGANEPIVATNESATFSCYVKAGAVTWCRVMAEGTFGEAHFNLTGAGAIGATPLFCTPSIEAHRTIDGVLTGWYRCSVTVRRQHIGGNGLLRVYAAASDGGSTYAATSTTAAQVYLWGGQYVTANWAGPYTRTDAAAIDTGRIRNNLSAARASVPLLQNLLLWSEDFGNAAWSKEAGVTVTVNQAANPVDELSGVTTLTADLIDVTAAAVGAGFFQVTPATRQVRGLYVTRFIWLKGLLGGEVVQLETPSNSAGTKTCTLTTAWQLFVHTEVATNTLASNTDANGLWVRKTSGNRFYAWGAGLAITNALPPYAATTTAAVNPAGSIRVAVPQQQNLIVQSETFETSWNVTGLKPVLADHQLIASDLTDAVHQIFLTEPTVPLGTTQTFSVLVKPGAVTWMGLLVDGTFLGQAYGLTGAGVIGFSDVQGNGVIVGKTISGPDENGFYLCTLTVVRTHAPATVRIYAANADSSIGSMHFVAPNTTSPLLTLGRAQVTNANWLGPYARTTTLAINGGRLRDAVPTQQNLFKYSEELSNGAVWSNSNFTVGVNATLAPNGTLTADSVAGSGGATTHHDSQATSFLCGQTVYTASIYCKRSGNAGAWDWIAFGPNGSGAVVYLDLVNKVPGTTITRPQDIIEARVEDVPESVAGVAGWVRCIVTFIQRADMGTTVFFFLFPGNGVVSAAPSGVVDQFWWGAELVEGSVPGPYVKTVAATVTTGRLRNAA